VGDTAADAYSHQEAVAWIRQAIGEDQQRYLAALPAGPLEAGGCRLVHGAPHDEDAYLATASDVVPLLDTLAPGVIFFGHTHRQGGFLHQRHGPVESIAAVAAGVQSALLHLREDAGYLLNPGSVGQPRDKDPRAAYAIYDAAGATVEFRRTGYDIAAAQRNIRQAGLPDKMAWRLDLGL
jgi:diadenosine tetraphosphatase ApaH/serine/threonine PP2A family protein phosphatase